LTPSAHSPVGVDVVVGILRSHGVENGYKNQNIAKRAILFKFIFV
jgi:hypothetical protein